MLLLKCLQTFAVRLEFSRQLDLLAGGGLHGVAGMGLRGAGLFQGLFKVLLPGFGAAVWAQQGVQGLLAGMLLREPFVQGLLQRVLLGALMAVLHLLALEGLAARRMLGEFLALLLQVRKPLGHLLIQRHETGRRVRTQFGQALGRQQAGERRQFLFEALGVGVELHLLVGQLPGGQLAGVAAALDVALQLCGVPLQGEQGVLTFFVTADAVVQLFKPMGQPRRPLGRGLVLPLRMVRVRLQAGGECLLVVQQLLMLQAQFAQLRIQAADLFTQLIEGGLECVHGLAGRRLFVFVMARKALQQGFGLVVRVFVAAADRARLVVLQVLAQFFNTGAAGQSLALQQLAGDVQCLLGRLVLFFGLGAEFDPLFAF